jgi:hypothetical protein
MSSCCSSAVRWVLQTTDGKHEWSWVEDPDKRPGSVSGHCWLGRSVEVPREYVLDELKSHPYGKVMRPKDPFDVVAMDRGSLIEFLNGLGSYLGYFSYEPMRSKVGIPHLLEKGSLFFWAGSSGQEICGRIQSILSQHLCFEKNYPPEITMQEFYLHCIRGSPHRYRERKAISSGSLGAEKIPLTGANV